MDALDALVFLILWRTLRAVAHPAVWHLSVLRYRLAGWRALFTAARGMRRCGPKRLSSAVAIARRQEFIVRVCPLRTTRSLWRIRVRTGSPPSDRRRLGGTVQRCHRPRGDRVSLSVGANRGDDRRDASDARRSSTGRYGRDANGLAAGISVTALPRRLPAVSIRTRGISALDSRS
jgi:hypothetical protein